MVKICPYLMLWAGCSQAPDYRYTEQNTGSEVGKVSAWPPPPSPVEGTDLDLAVVLEGHHLQAGGASHSGGYKQGEHGV